MKVAACVLEPRAPNQAHLRQDGVRVSTPRIGAGAGPADFEATRFAISTQMSAGRSASCV